jgi:hypothetical protein
MSKEKKLLVINNPLSVALEAAAPAPTLLCGKQNCIEKMVTAKF